jgi:uncharacterized repeat protein (TIGR03803 family)
LSLRARCRTFSSYRWSNGSAPLADLYNLKGVLYGTTSVGGANNLGTVFRLTKVGKAMVLYSFTDGSGQEPRAGLTAIGGTLYGTTFGAKIGSIQNYGNVFSITP